MKKFWEGLKQRHVIHVAAIYLIVAWLVVQVTIAAEGPLMLPDWFDTAVMFLAGIGFPFALILAWAFELTPDGVKKSSEVFADKADGKESVDIAHKDEPTGDEKPSIAVMPFANLSDDKETDYLADGMTEDIITGLSFDPHLAVVSRNAVFVYKDKPVDLRDVGRDLGVRYALEGSLRRVTNRIRVTAQLIETRTGSHIWAEKFDRPFAEIFDVQDEVISEILSSVGTQLTAAELQRMRNGRAARVGSWGSLQMVLYTASTAMGNPQKMIEMTETLKSAIEQDPDAGYLHAILVFLCAALVVNGSAVDLAAYLEDVQKHSTLALKLGNNDPTSLTYVGVAKFYFGQYEEGERLLRRSLAINPNDGLTIIHLGLLLANIGSYEKSHECFERARRISSAGPFANELIWYEAIALCVEGRLEEADRLTREFLSYVEIYPGGVFYHGLILSLLGRTDDAVKAIRKGHELDPGATLPRLLPFLSANSDPEESARRMEVFSAAWKIAFDTAGEGEDL